MSVLHNPAPSISRRHAALAAQGTAAVWGILAMLLVFACFRAGVSGPLYLVLALTAGAMAVFVDRRRTVPLAVMTTWIAVAMSVVGLVLFFCGSANGLLIPFFVMPLAVAGLRGAIALRDLPPTFRVDVRV